MSIECRKLIGCAMIVLACATCGGDDSDSDAGQQDFGPVDLITTADFSPSECIAMGGHCAGVEDGCTINGVHGNYAGPLDCYYLCCVPAKPCVFSCDGGSGTGCACDTQSETCIQSSSPVSTCTCAASTSGGAGYAWVCGS